MQNKRLVFYFVKKTSDGRFEFGFRIASSVFRPKKTGGFYFASITAEKALSIMKQFSPVGIFVKPKGIGFMQYGR